MKTIKYTAYAFAVTTMLGMTACQSNDFDTFGNECGTDNGRVLMTVGLSFDQEDATRTILSEENGDIKALWESTDKVIVTSASGVKYGELSLESGDGTTSAKFSGELTNVSEGESTFRFIYAAGGKDLESLSYNLASQNGDYKDFNASDLLYGEKACTPINGQITIDSPLTLNRYNSFGRFSITLPSGVTYNGEDIKVYSKSVNWKTKFELNAASSTLGATSDNNPKDENDRDAITISPKSGVNNSDFYVNVLPGEYDLEFAVTIGGVEYRGWLPSRKWDSSVYKRNATTADGVTTTAPIQVSCVDHSINPLAKWAESDLVRVGSGKSATGTFAKDYTVSGYYYQFGTNFGYVDSDEIALNYSTEKDIVSNTNGTFSFPYYGDGTQTMSAVYSKTSLKYFNKDLNVKEPSTTMFYMNSGDYCAFDNVPYAHDWSYRASTVRGFEYAMPCPDGWTIPTKDDYEQILPKINGNYGSSTWDEIEDIKKVGNNNIPCRFKWSKYTDSKASYLKIQCIVLSSDNDDVNWSNANVVERYFKLAGCINPTVSNYTWTNYYVAGRPQMYGDYTLVKVNPYRVGKITYYNCQWSRKIDYMNVSGFYWTQDANQTALVLCTSAISNAQLAGIYDYNVGYYLKSPKSSIGANIRCIRSN